MYNPKVPTAIMDAMLDIIGVDADTGFIDIYNGTQPANGGDALTGQTMLCSFPLPADAFPAASDRKLTANAIDNANAAASGSANWFRMYKADHTTPIIDGSAGVPRPGNDFDLELANDDLVTGQAQGIVSCIINGNN
jgi:hypothetical protein